MLGKLFDFLGNAIWVLTGLGVLGIFLLMEEEEAVFPRILGGLVAVILSPIMLAVFSYLIVVDLFERTRHRT